MDFSELLTPYCSENIINKFKDNINKSSISSLLLNPNKDNSFISNIGNITKDKNDDILFRFDKEENRLGKCVEHFAGGFYLLDPSSATISYYLKDYVKENPIVLDMCAAPGGKSISFAFRRRDSLILSNDISYTRALEITKNTDRLGLTNVISLSIDPMNISSSLDSSFDLIILDVPCSGSGMIRKEEKMLEDWSIEKVNRLLPIQKNLLNKAYELVKKDGIICYSTCSLSVEEDENQIEEFLKQHKDVEEIKVKIKDENIISGKYGYHMIPGVFDGEGIYFCILKKKTGEIYSLKETKYKLKSPLSNLKAINYKKNTFLVDKFYDEFEKLPIIVPGIKLFDSTEHPKCQYDHSYSKIIENDIISLSREQAIKYAKGDEISINDPSSDGLKVAVYNNLRLGFGKKVKNKFKNYLPKGLRMDLI